MTEINEPRTITLVAPTIHDALDGGLGYDDLAKNPGRLVVIQTGPWGDVKAGDVIDILWGPNLDVIASHRYTTSDNQLPQLIVEASKLSRYGEGMIPLAAQITLVVTGEVHRTNAVDVRVKLSVPGGIDTDPESEHRNDALALPRVFPLPIPDDHRGVSVVVPAYENMSEGDRVTVQWHTAYVRTPPLPSATVGQDVRVSIPMDVVASAPHSGISVRYEIHDVVANWSLWSPHTVVDRPPGIGTPPAPWVMGTVSDEGEALDLSVLGDKDVTVRVKGHPASAGSELAVIWEGVSALGKPLRFETERKDASRPGQTIDFTIPNRMVKPLAAGRATVGYVIYSIAKPPLYSERRGLAILGTARELLAPSVLEAVKGILDPQEAGKGVHVIVPAWDGLSGEDRCYLEWVGTRVDGSNTFYRAVLRGSDALPEGKLQFTVPPDEVTRISGGSLRLRYSVALESPIFSDNVIRTETLVHMASPWLELTVAAAAVPLSIDSTPVALSGAMVRLEASVTVPPEGTFIVRMATGGTPPYRYAASHGAVEVDEATGRVVSLRNGEATVTVTDAEGAAASYPVKVSNVLHFVDINGLDTWYNAGRAAAANGMRLPSLAEWDALRASYGGAPPTRQDAGWTSHQVDKFNHYVVYPANGAREPRRSFGLGKPHGTAAQWAVTAPTV
jgi:hypothetical protein